ncbi:MAG: peroxidase family protein [Phycisphaeraceae bacterium]|nr:peroxidase family protein [Phycisphaeraceae bacterium]
MRQAQVGSGFPAARGAGMVVAALVLGAGAGGVRAQEIDTRFREYRSYDGSGNNRNRPSWGMAGSNYLRESSGAHYGDGRSAPAGAGRPAARLISNVVVAQGGLETADSRGLSTCVYEFGQFLDHDIGLARGGSSEVWNIPVPTGDPFFDPNSTGTMVIGFTRSGFDPATGGNSARQQVNTVTAFIDASHIYGSDAARAGWLRSGVGGRLKSVQTEYGEMLPYNDGTLENDNPLGHPATSMYAAGDVRANEQVGLTSLHCAFVREHNWQADRLRARHPDWSDERLYQEARRWVGAEMQVIVANEWLPALLGRRMPEYSGYKPWVNPGLSNAFATAGFRIGHSMVGEDIDLLDADFEEAGVIELAEAFFNPYAIAEAGGIEPVVRYFAASTQQETDTMIVDPLRNFLFGPPGAGGFDLAALNIQRGRDHGLADYNTMRRDFGLARVRRFSDITSDRSLVDRLRTLYGSVDSIDAWVGLLAEDHLPGSSMGPTHTAILLDQFTRLRDGDRFWYQNDQFSREEVRELESTRLSTILRRTTGIARLQESIFFAMEFGGGCPADTDHNGVVEPADISVYVNAWIGSVADGTLAADFDSNGAVDAADVAAYIAAWVEALSNGC